MCHILRRSVKKRVIPDVRHFFEMANLHSSTPRRLAIATRCPTSQKHPDKFALFVCLNFGQAVLFCDSVQRDTGIPETTNFVLNYL